VPTRRRYLCSIQCSDDFTTRWLTLFNEAGETFWGVKAEAILNATAITSRSSARSVSRRRGQMNADAAQFEDRIRVVVYKLEAAQEDADCD
jgi:hypothetical protein